MLTAVAFIVSLSVLIAYLVNFKWRKRRYIEAIEKFNGPPTVPIIGNVFDVYGTPPESIQKAMRLKDVYGSPYRFWIMQKPFIVISAPEDFEIVANETLEKDNIHELITEVVGDGIFTAGVEKWKKGRRLFNPAFNTAVLSKYFMDVFNDQSLELVRQLNKHVDTGKHFDLWPYFIERSVSTICETTLDYYDREHDYNLPQFIDASTKLAELFSKRAYQPWLQPSLLFKLYCYITDHTKYRTRVYDFANEILRVKREKLKELYGDGKTDINKNTSDEPSEKTIRKLIDILLGKTGFSNQFSEDEMQAEIIAVLFAGSETSAVTACFVLLVLAIRKDMQEKVFQELHDIFGDDDRLPELEDLPKMHFLEQCLKETLRRFPVVPFIFRYTDHDIRLSGGEIIPANTTITLGIMGLHHNKTIYPEPLVWNPDNFSPENMAKRHKSSFLPFSTGPRGCIGQKYAWLSLKAQLAVILRNYKLTTDVKMEDIEVYPHLTVKSLHGYNVKLQYRYGKSLF